MVINILTSPDAMDSIQLGTMPVVLFIGLILSFIFFEIYVLKKIFSFNNEYKIKINKKINKNIILPMFIIMVFDKVSYGVASLFNKSDILSSYRVIPLYQPLTFGGFLHRNFGIRYEIETNNNIKLNAKLNYPTNKIILKENPNKINIFIIASDAVNNSVLSKEITPNIEKLKKDSIVLGNHYSGGNSTRFGIFSLLYGLNSTYWFTFLNASKGSVFFDVLKQLQYDMSIVSSTNTSWPEFKKTAYFNIVDKIKDDFKGKPWEKDKQGAKYLIDRIDKHDSTKPMFSFVFFDSPHGYSFPKDFNKFNANEENINYLTMNKDSEDLKSVYARYKNSVAYNDKLFGEIIQKLKEKGIYDNSLIIYTSDHGQEFYEYGNFGHNSSFSKAQANTPLIIKLPKSLQTSHTIKDNNVFTSHIDIVPTLLSIIGVENPTKDYSNGYDLFDKNYKRDYVFSANWNNNAIITPKLTYVFSNMPNRMFKNETRFTSTYSNVIKKVKIDSKLVLDAMNENRRFLK
jgi:membrane-anchored protein YejM (alkaline phosphatase superfamily)